MSLIPANIAKALKEYRRLAYEENSKTSNYADGINSLAKENDGGITDVAEIANENDEAITDLAEYVATLEARVEALEEKEGE